MRNNKHEMLYEITKGRWKDHTLIELMHDENIVDFLTEFPIDPSEIITDRKITSQAITSHSILIRTKIKRDSDWCWWIHPTTKTMIPYAYFITTEPMWIFPHYDKKYLRTDPIRLHLRQDKVIPNDILTLF